MLKGTNCSGLGIQQGCHQDSGGSGDVQLEEDHKSDSKYPGAIIHLFWPENTLEFPSKMDTGI